MIHTGINSTEIAALIASAKRRIVFHAALYSRFAQSPEIVAALHFALENARGNQHFQGLHCITLDPATIPATATPMANVDGTAAGTTDFAANPVAMRDQNTSGSAVHGTPPTPPDWANSFFAMLRPHTPVDELVREFSFSHMFIEGLAARYRGMVCHYITRACPTTPILIIDGTILCGHYLHGSLPAPDGFWFSLAAPVEFLFSCAQSDAPPSDPQQRAAYRFITECQHAMRGSLCHQSSRSANQQHPRFAMRNYCHAV